MNMDKLLVMQITLKAQILDMDASHGISTTRGACAF